MRRVRLISVLIMILDLPRLCGQTIDWKQSISIGAGISVPNDWSHRFKKAPVLNLDYGYRLKRHIQADIGIETVINGWDTYELCRFSSTPVTNAGLGVPFGGRVLLPFNSERVLLSAGAGGAYFHYTSACAAAGIGEFAAWGAYSLAGASVAVSDSLPATIVPTTGAISKMVGSTYTYSLQLLSNRTKLPARTEENHLAQSRLAGPWNW